MDYFSLAQELKLHDPPPYGCGELERLNRIRTWLMVVKVDHSFALQFGKPPMVPLGGHITRLPKVWYQSSSMNLPFDIHICQSVDMLIVLDELGREMGNGSDQVRALPQHLEFWGLTDRMFQSIDVPSLTLHYEQRLNDLIAYWIPRTLLIYRRLNST